VALLLLLLTLGAPAAQRVTVQPFVPISVWYPPTGELDALRRDFNTLRTAGFNTITTWISWRDGEPKRGHYSLLNVDRLIAVAAESGLKVQVIVYTEPEPAWKTDGTNALAGPFYEHVRTRMGPNPAVLDVSVTARPNHTFERSVVGSQPHASTPRRARLELWSAIAEGRLQYGFIDPRKPVSESVLALGGTVGVITRNPALFAPLQPDRKREPVVAGAGRVVVRILESAEAMVIVAINTANDVRRVTITFPPDVPEAIWQNMEEGMAVHFVMGRNGPYLEHTFAPEDVLVLAIRKKYR
jgi:hypothetical protein